MLPICFIYIQMILPASDYELEKLFIQYSRIEKIQPEYFSKNSCFEKCVQDFCMILFLLNFFVFNHSHIVIISEEFKALHFNS